MADDEEAKLQQIIANHVSVKISNIIDW
jgi:hypothetical protein